MRVSSSGPPESTPAELLKIPTILLEGDEPRPAGLTGTGPKYALGPAAAAPVLGLESGELPEAYGTGRLTLTARDPNCLYANWDLTGEQQRHYNALSADRHFVLRVYLEQPAGTPAVEVRLHPESRHWFVHVEQAGRRYAAELGYYQADRQWRTIAVSDSVPTPTERPAEANTVSFATLHWKSPQPVPRQSSQASASPVPGAPLTPAPMPPPPFVTRRSRFEKDTPPGSMAALPAEWQAPSEFVRSLTRQHERDIPSPNPIQHETVAPVQPPMTLSSSMEGGPPERKGFWLTLNAELVIYGATTPDARVSLGGQLIRLRPDGTFSYRFALPDGMYELPINAISPNGEARHAELSFSRGTRYQGHIGVHPPDTALQPPPARAV